MNEADWEAFADQQADALEQEIAFTQLSPIARRPRPSRFGETKMTIHRCLDCERGKPPSADPTFDYWYSQMLLACLWLDFAEFCDVTRMWP